MTSRRNGVREKVGLVWKRRIFSCFIVDFLFLFSPKCCVEHRRRNRSYLYIRWVGFLIFSLFDKTLFSLASAASGGLHDSRLPATASAGGDLNLFSLAGKIQGKQGDPAGRGATAGFGIGMGRGGKGGRKK